MDKIWANGFREITSSTHPIKTVQDLNGYKIRVPVGALWISLFEALGAAPTSIPWSEACTALQTKIVADLTLDREMLQDVIKRKL